MQTTASPAAPRSPSRRPTLDHPVRVALLALGLAAAGCGAGADADRAAQRSARVTLATGPTLEYCQRGPDAGAAVLLLHGYTDAASSFDRVLPLLPADLRLLAVDQRGHGRSTTTMPTHTMADLTADAVAFLDALGIERATIVGHSLGSLVAQRVAIEHPHRVDRLVLIGSMVRGGNPATLGMLDEIRRLDDPVPDAFARGFQQSTLHRPVPDRFFERVVAASRGVPARVWQQVAASFLAEDTSDRLAAITAPTLILWGDRDAYFPRSDQETLQRTIAGARLQVLADIGHAPHWEHPEAVARAITDFLQRGAAAR